MSAQVRVAVIGGGAGGVIAAKCLRDVGLAVVLFEKAAELGGVWKYEHATHTDSSMYKSLRTNLPTAVMQLGGFPFPPGIPSFVTHRDVLQYIQDYATHYNVTDVARLRSSVVGVSKQSRDATCRPWKIDVESQERGAYSEHFDKVLVCNGHFAEPFYGSIDGIEHFAGETLHSHDYRTPAPFLDKTVLLLGCGPSGQDISLELVRSGAAQVTVAFKEYGERPVEPTDLRILKPPIDRILPDGTVVFTDSTSQEAPDVIMYCTGYLYTGQQLVPKGTLYPELQLPTELDPDTQSELQRATTSRNAIAPLYHQLFSIEEPDVAFIGLPFRNLPFLCFELQAKWAAHVFTGDVALPSKQKMLDSFVEEVRTLPFPIRKLHQLGAERQRSYFEELAGYSNTKCDPIVQEMFEDSGFLRSTYPLVYREATYGLEDGRWVRRLDLQDSISEELVRVFE